MAYIREYPPPPPPIALGSNQKFEKIKHQLCWPNTSYLLDLVKRSVKFSFNSLAISEFISIITKTSIISLVVVSQLVNNLHVLWLLAPIKNEIFRATKSFTGLKKARKKGHLDLWHPLKTSSP